jgi:ParB family chromosome partitioning protein
MSGAQLRMVPVSQLVANRRNVREKLEGIDELAASIRARGLLQPLIVNDRAGTLEVTDGHRRLEASRRAGLPSVLCIVTTDVDAHDVHLTMLAASMHKELRPIEQGRAFQRLRAEGMTTAQISRATGYSVARILSRLALLELPADAQDMVDDGTLTLAQAAELARQVKARRSGSTSAGRPTGGSTFWRDHRLARVVRETCTHRETHHSTGGAGCGRCWETVIRADERERIAREAAAS